jgi:hypothetical protein
LKDQLKLWDLALLPPPGILGALKAIGAISLLALILVVVFGVPLGLLLIGFAPVGDALINFFHLQSLTNPIYVIATGPLAMLSGPWMLLSARRNHTEAGSNPPQRGLVRHSAAWPYPSARRRHLLGRYGTLRHRDGPLSCSRLCLLAQYSALVVLDCLMFPSVPRVIFTPLLRRFRRPARPRV